MDTESLVKTEFDFVCVSVFLKINFLFCFQSLKAGNSWHKMPHINIYVSRHTHTYEDWCILIVSVVAVILIIIDYLWRPIS